MITYEEFFKAYPRKEIHWDRYIYINQALAIISQTELADIRRHGYSLKSNEIIFKYKFHKEDCDSKENVDNGFLATLVDTVSTISIMIYQKNNNPSVTLNLDLSFIENSNLKLNDEVYIITSINNFSNNIVTMSVNLYRTNMEVVLQASHTKFKINPKF